ncbi:MAG: DUF4184 family protein [Nitrososphaerota archaeon]|nr:DUF4184 family protein [Nitrososphaerales archaeon]MDW8044513.1 DUF4184 family protein [Nitrososphaerota archaeon]
MPFTPLHFAYPWLLKWRFNSLNTLTLIVASFVPDVENSILMLMGIYPNRLVTHSLIGVFTIDPALAILIAYILTRINLESIGLPNLKPLTLNFNLITSAIVGALLHVSIDTLHHEYNPIFWQMGPTYITGPLVVWFGPIQAHLIIHLFSLLLLIYVLKKILNERGERLSLLYKDPLKTIRLLIESINR